MGPIGSLLLREKLPAHYLDAHSGKELKELSQLSRVNIFVGATSSGKSKLLRHLSCMNPYAAGLSEADAGAIRVVRKTQISLREAYDQRNVAEFGNVKLKELETPAADYRLLGSDSHEPIRTLLTKLARTGEHSSVTASGGGGIFQTQTFAPVIKKLADQGLQALKGLVPSPPAPKRVYVPVIRGLRPVGKEDEDPFLVRTRTDYFREDQSKSPEIFTGATLYREVRDLLLGVAQRRKAIREFQTFLSNVFFDGLEVTIIPHTGKDVLFVKIGQEHDRPIFDLGDGIQQAIILTFLPFTRQESTFFFIEEPEVHMHPGLQRKLLDFYSQHEACKRHHFFLTTHSNHLLDMTADFDEIAVINFRKRIPPTGDDEREPEFLVEPVEGGDERSLQLLGVRNSSVFLVNATIWVEGITDRLYLRRFLQLYEEKHKDDPNLTRLQEDVHYSIVEYGGSNITHWSWLQDDDGTPSITVERLCSRVFLLADQDGADKKLERKAKLETKLGKRFEVIPGREIENLLPLRVIRQVVLDYEKEPQNVRPFEGLPEHQNEPLGAYIEERVLAGPRRRTGSYREGKGGRLSQKPPFAKKALEYLTDYDELSAGTRGLVDRIRGFIVEQNDLQPR